MNLGMISMSLHNGSHADARYHFEDDGWTMEQARLETYIGPAVVADLSAKYREGAMPQMTIDDLAPWDAELQSAPRLLLKTNVWTDSRVFPKEIPTIAPEVPAWLEARGVRLLGFDVPSVDTITSKDLRNHHALAAAGISIIESLDLSAVARRSLPIHRAAAEDRGGRWFAGARGLVARMIEPADGMIGRPALVRGVAVLIAILFAVTNLPWHLDDYDQAKQAFTSFEMVQEGHWLYQHTPNEKIATKPPLVGWVSAAIFGVTRSWEIAWRLPSFAAAVALLWFLFRAARSAYGLAAGGLAMAAFGLNLLSPRLATLVRTDMPLALVIFLLGLTIFEKVRSAQPWSARDRWIMFALLTAAMLIKGPIVYAFLLPGLVAFQWWKRDGGVSAWCGWWPWLASLAVFALWVAGGIAWAPGFYEQVVLREFAGRFSETVHRPQPFYFYLPHLLHRFAPWSVLMLALGVCRLARRRASENLRALARASARDRVAGALELGRAARHVAHPVETGRSNFPDCPAALFVARGAICGAERAPGFDGPCPALECDRARRRLSGDERVFGAESVRWLPGQRSGVGSFRRRSAGASARKLAGVTKWWADERKGCSCICGERIFLSMDEAIAQWRSGALDALVLPAEELPRAQSEMPEATLSNLEATVTANGTTTRYVLVTRPRP